jgi:transposase-like protein
MVGFLGFGGGGVMLTVGLGTNTYWIVPIGLFLMGLEFWLLGRVQQWECPKCGKPFAYQRSPLLEHWATFKILGSKKCKSCGFEKRS